MNIPKIPIWERPEFIAKAQAYHEGAARLRFHGFTPQQEAAYAAIRRRQALEAASTLKIVDHAQ